MERPRSWKIIFFIFLFFLFLPHEKVSCQELEHKAGLAKIDLADIGIPIIFWRSVEYGVGAGLLVGLASITDFKKNFKVNNDDKNLARGASYGLYGGIILGLYLAYVVPERSNPPQEDAPLPEQTLQMKHLEKLQVNPLLSSDGSIGVQLSWSI